MPNYSELVRFLIAPLLDSEESVSVDCEQLNNCQRIWVRIAVKSNDKGRVYGRGGRNLKAIHTILSATAKGANQSLYLDVYGGENTEDNAKTISRRSAPPKPRN
ncbi:KH domain-containing protein [Gloeocapsa sp. PCC 73106]|uniref:KH domain-containing protein n=1 Tax=Gloeocapsa sp. PCC 73106 TaxID=102232 RepID=UPI0002AC092D|nr:KH domain-containing protein [Gloeocapsa sp. PCC 73106]ELR98690.1 putative RNA-binding protein (contains KH domain) [Gloeocapsa sp. PCC 73106]